MTFFSQFAVSSGLALVGAAVIVAWVFRTTGAPLWQRLLVPAVTVAAAAYAPFAVNSMMGLPVSTTIAELPDKATLLAFVPADGERMVDIWLVRGGLPPRAYEVALDPKLKKELREAEERQGHGQQVVMSHRKRVDGDRPHGNRDGKDDDELAYVIDEAAMPRLPPKE
jgi:hypothetical protein